MWFLQVSCIVFKDNNFVKLKNPDFFRLEFYKFFLYFSSEFVPGYPMGYKKIVKHSTLENNILRLKFVDFWTVEWDFRIFFMDQDLGYNVTRNVFDTK